MALEMEMRQIAVGTVVFIVTGDLDAAESIEFDKKIVPLSEEEALRLLILDWTGLDYISSAGLRVLMKVVETTQANGCRLCCVGVQGSVLSVLKMTGFTKYLELYPTVDDCLAAK